MLENFTFVGKKRFTFSACRRTQAEKNPLSPKIVQN